MSDKADLENKYLEFHVFAWAIDDLNRSGAIRSDEGRTAIEEITEILKRERDRSFRAYEDARKGAELERLLKPKRKR
jgi:hypothetical protein